MKKGGKRIMVYETVAGMIAKQLKMDVKDTLHVMLHTMINKYKI